MTASFWPGLATLSTCAVSSTGMPSRSRRRASKTMADAPQLWPNRRIRALCFSSRGKSAVVIGVQTLADEVVSLGMTAIAEDATFNFVGMLFAQIAGSNALRCGVASSAWTKPPTKANTKVGGAEVTVDVFTTAPSAANEDGENRAAHNTTIRYRARPGSRRRIPV